ncbi:MAG: MCE family protein [Oscillatoriophycideae cyanobacterium NC_groundwater_1537_Pr4_S-0.65um_50_18]|nr:MCE family protein [Oscillatoriophycideae cyanobacterium NC_groundwater_1537_Pr4_S-0.65um_50_18]
MRSRTVREGSVGLLILLGLGVLGGLFLWLRGFNPASRSYRAVIQFPEVAGIQVGAPVSYRGVSVGRVVDVRAGANAVDVEIEISPGTLVIPKNAIVEANQGGLIGATAIDITPQNNLTSNALAQNPLAANCDSEVVVCDGDRLAGNVGVSFSALVRSTTQFADLFSNPQFFNEVRALTRNSASAAAGVSVLTGEVTKLTKSVQSELGTLSTAASSSATSVGQAANQLGLTAAQVNGLLAENRTSLVSTLNSIDQTSRQVQGLVGSLAPQVENGEILQNLETLSANAAEASANLRDLTATVGSPDNMLMLQQTLDSARATFQNAQKITSDLDELTGDPQLRDSIRELINGFSSLVSSSQRLQQQAAIAQALSPVGYATTIEPEKNQAVESEAVKESAPSDRPSAPVTTLQMPTDAEYRAWLNTFATARQLPAEESNSQPNAFQ